MLSAIYVGCAGWSIPKEHAQEFVGDGTHLSRYASRLPCVEVNSSFYRPHRTETYRRWADTTPPEFRFAVKIPKQITHEQRLCDCGEPLEALAAQVAGLGDKLGPLLVQLPPSLEFDESIASRFFVELREWFSTPIVCEPRHPTWFTPAAEELLTHRQIARVAADPAVVISASQTGGWPGFAYYRLHGSPRMYYSAYSTVYLEELAARLNSHVPSPVWCIFDNTAAGEAMANALALWNGLQPQRGC